MSSIVNIYPHMITTLKNIMFRKNKKKVSFASLESFILVINIKNLLRERKKVTFLQQKQVFDFIFNKIT